VDLSQYFRGIGRRWKIILVCLIVALGVGWVLSPEQPRVTHSTTGYSATTYLLGASSGISFRDGSNIDTVARLVTLGPVPEQVAEELDYEGDPADLAATVTAEPDDTTQFLNITARAPTAARATLVADTFAEQLIDYLGTRTTEQVDELRREIDQIDRKIARLSEDLPQGRASGESSSTRDDEASPSPEPETDEGGRSDADIQAEIDSLNAERQTLQGQLTSLSTTGGSDLSGFEVVATATATPTGGDEGLEAPRSRMIRLLIAAAIGLLLGMALALLLERVDTRIRSKRAAEEAYGLPVLAVIPTIGRRRRGAILTQAAPRGPGANAFRLLAAALQFGWQDMPARDGSGNGAAAHAPRTLLVTSGEPREGKSTIVANLAATFADVGKRVVVLCCDYRHPTLHATFGVAHEPGLIDALEGSGDMELDSLLQDTKVEGVRVLSTGRVPTNAGALLASERMGDLLVELGALADVVVIDTAPVLAASDWTQLIPRVDEVIVVARAGKTDAASARRTAEILGLLKAPVVGAVLNGVPTGLIRQAADRSWYRYQAPERARPAGRKPAEPPVTVLPEAGIEGNGGNGSRSDEGIPHLARPATKE
jgi:capsular exopolysaccharide synthesis family protein